MIYNSETGITIQSQVVVYKETGSNQKLNLEVTKHTCLPKKCLSWPDFDPNPFFNGSINISIQRAFDVWHELTKFKQIAHFGLHSDKAENQAHFRPLFFSVRFHTNILPDCYHFKCVAMILTELLCGKIKTWP